MKLPLHPTLIYSFLPYVTMFYNNPDLLDKYIARLDEKEIDALLEPINDLQKSQDTLRDYIEKDYSNLMIDVYKEKHDVLSPMHNHLLESGATELDINDWIDTDAELKSIVDAWLNGGFLEEELAEALERTGY